MKNILYEGYLGPRLPREVQLKRVQRVMQEELTPLQRETLIAFYFQEQTLTQIAADRGVNKSTVCRKSLFFFSLADLICTDQASGHISGQGMIFAGFAVFYIYAETVSIRICCQYQISIQFFCHAKSQCESFCRFRIRITYGREIAIWKFLLRNHIDVLETKLF